MCLLMVCSMIGCKRTACWMCSFWRIASSRSVALTREMLNPSCSARRDNSALRDGCTHATTCTVCRFLLCFLIGGLLVRWAVVCMSLILARGQQESNEFLARIAQELCKRRF